MTNLNPLEELSRKVNEALLNLLHLKKEERITNSEFNLGLRTLWIATAGLISYEPTQMISDILSGNEMEGTVERQLWAGKGKLLMLSWNRYHCAVELKTLPDGKIINQSQYINETEPFPGAKATARHEKLVDGLVKAGYKRLM